MRTRKDYVEGFFASAVAFVRLFLRDRRREIDDRRRGIVRFKPYGLTVYSGRQGSGKTMGIVEASARAREMYPDALIVSNFDCRYAHQTMRSLNDLLTVRNGEDGVIFLIDELQNEFSSSLSKDFPESLLSVITMQRKQRIAIWCTSQVFTRLAKPLREQSYEVCLCRTYLGRLTRIWCYDAIDYIDYFMSTSDDRRRKCPKKWKHWFVQTDELRSAYDTYSVIERLSRKGFVGKVWHETAG